MTGVLMMRPVVTIVVELIRILAIFVSTYVGAEVVNEMSSDLLSAFSSNVGGFVLLPCLGGQYSFRAYGEAIRTFEKCVV